MPSPFDHSGHESASAQNSAIAPLSFEQEGIWLASRFAAAPDAFHNILALRLEGDLDVERLEDALTGLAGRHGILRSILFTGETRLGQRVIDTAPVRLSIVDAPEEARWKDEAFQQYLRQLARAPFDLESAPPWRVTLLRLSARDHVLLLVDHHLVLDATSSEVFLSETAALYNGDGAALPPVPVQYAEYAAGERARQAQIDADLAAWVQRLGGVTPRSISLPSRAATASPSGPHRRQHRFSIDAAFAADVDQLARQHRGTTFTAILAALSVTISRISGDLDVPLNIVKSTRRRPEVQRVIGVMVDTMPLRVNLAEPATFGTLLQQLRAELHWGFARPVPYFALMRALAEQQARVAHAGADILVNFQKVSTEPPAFGDLRASLLRIAGGHSTSAIALEIYSDNHGALDCLLDYDAHRFTPATIDRIAEGIEAFLRAAHVAPDAPLAALPTVSAGTTAARLREQPRGASTPAPAETVTALFADQVRANPGGLAIRDGDRDWSTRAIDEQSNRVAHMLRARGVTAGTRVGICLDRSAQFVIAALGVMKAGAAYVPVDPAYPAERIRLIAEIAQPACIISDATLAARLPAGVATVVLDLDTLAVHPATPVASALTPDSPAYVLFTSGSTGRPRGVVGLHRGIVNRIAWMRRTYPFWSDELCAQKTTIGFVDAVWEIFGPLTSGVPLVILPDAVVRDAHALVTALSQHHITRIVLVPSLLDAVLDASADLNVSLQRLRLCVSSGESLSPALAARFLDRLPHVTLLNIYGSSEVAADATWAEINRTSIGNHVSIGRPLDNVHVYVLDRARQLVPQGEEGELYVGGAGLAAGYAGDDAATAERFIDDPFATTTDARVFKTGDLGRVRDDGEIEIIGRADLQIKVRGRRIEPGEIEGRLTRHPSVRQAAVVYHRHRECLAAFVVPTSPDGIDRSALNEYLRHHLPEFMVPAVIVSIAELPLSPHGKVDRAALADRDLEDLTLAGGGAPATRLEQQVADLWTEILGVPPRSVDDEFIALGGHSLRATRLTWRIRERLGIDLSPGAIFEHSTVRLLAAEIARLGAADHSTGLPPIVPIERGDTTAPSSAQRQFWLEERLHDGRGANQHGGTYIVSGPFDIAAFDRSVSTLLARHESLRTVTQVEAGELRMRVRPAVPHASPVENLTRVPECERRQRLDTRLAAERRRPFALETELPFRVRIYRLAGDEHAISFSVHHSAFDGWSTAILMRELGALYQAERRATPLSLPSLPIQYADFAAWQRACVDGAAFAAQRDYWREQLADAPQGLDLPLDRQPRAGSMPRMARVEVVIDDSLANQLRAIGQTDGATTFMTLAAGYAALLARYSGQWDIVIGTAAANRRLPSTQSVIGAFVNPLALRLRLDPTATFSAAIRVARTVTTDAFAHQDVPFDVVVADVAPQRHAERTPLFETLFVMQDRDGWDLELDGLRAEELDTPPGVSPIPLSLVMREDGAAVRGHFEYRADLFDADTVERMSANFLTLLRHAAATPAQTVQALTIVSDRERERVSGFEGTIAPEPKWERLELTFARHAEHTPDAPALATLDASASYAEVRQRAQHVAARLITMGVAPGNVVAIQVPRSMPLFVAMLGVLQAGAAYVFVDPQQPAERRRLILEDAGAAVLVSADGVPASDDDLLVSPLTPEILTTADQRPSAQSLACLVYTSGSSGQPKGVRITHRNIAAMCDAWGTQLGVSAASRFAQMVSPAFDVALGDIFASWTHGACVCLLDAADSLPGKAMVAALARMGVTHWTIPPSLLAECPAAPWPELEVIALGGEPPAHDVFARWTAARVISAYGLTEATVASTAEDFVVGTQPAVGRPIRNTQVTIVDDRGVAVPIGVAGHMTIAGPQVADGYHRRPELTAERFIRTERGTRLHTFDRAQWRADGRVEFLGRRDRQLKFHGYRIEPGEIEAAARSHAGVEHAFVIVRRDPGHDERLVAYVVPRPGHKASADAVRAHLRAALPAPMCPTDVVFVPVFPRTVTGKIDERALPSPGEAAEPSPAPRRPSGNTQELIAAVWREVLGHSRFGPEDSFFDAGGHSLLAVRAHDRLAAHFGDAISVVDLFAHPTITALARHLEGRVTAPAATATRPAPATGAIAIIGMACRYPQSRNVDELWQHLVDGRECLTRLSPEALTAAGVDTSTQADPRFVPVAGVLADVDQFDAEFFGLSAAEARLIDPQQRLLLELSQVALDSAGYDSRRYEGRIGVFAGVGFNTYLHEVLYPAGIPSTAEGFAAISANDKDFAASQVAFRLDLRGPAITVQTACSTSLVAVDTAIQALHAGRCDMALAGGVSIRLPQDTGYRHEDGMILSPDGHCRPFDASAAGTVGSNGGGVVLLKPLAAALADGDQIDAVILGSASNNDGRRKMAFTAPGVEGQVEVIRAALDRAGVDPGSVQYVETHGTGTSLGDPIEIQALAEAYGSDGDARLAIGSIKSNLGHTDTAAGVAGLIKAALSLKHKRIPPSLHFTAPNPHIDFGGRMFVADREQAFPAHPRRAAVSAFGIGGTNAHVILEQAPVIEPATVAPQVARVLPVSARSEDALRATCADLDAMLGRADAALDDVAFTLQRGRRQHPHRHAVVAASIAEAQAALRQRARGAGVMPVAAINGCAWLFSGQGSQQPGMGRALYESQPVAREWIDRCASLARPQLGLDLRELLCGDDPSIHKTKFAQPALFSLQYALARTWASFGLAPTALIGHSIGEFAAACFAGVFSLEDAVSLVCERGRLMQACPSGSMMAVRLSESAVRVLIGADPIDIAAVNAEASCVVAGATDAIQRFHDRLTAAGHASRLLVTSHAFHSRLMAGAEEAFERAVAGIRRSAPTIPMVSTLTGEWLTDEDAVDPGRWRQQLREPVRFLDAVRSLERREACALLEIGPDSTLSALTLQIVTDETRCITASLPSINNAAARLWSAGATLDWTNVGPATGRRVALPGSAFQRTPHWGEAKNGKRAAHSVRPFDEWFSVPSWYRHPLASAPRDLAGNTWLIVNAANQTDHDVARLIEAKGATVQSASPADAAAAIRAHRPSRVIYLTHRESDLERALDLGLHGLTDCIRALGEDTNQVEITLITTDLLDVTGTEDVDPAHAPAVGVLKIVPHEYPHIACKHIDVTSGIGSQTLIDELTGNDAETTVALRGTQRWLPSWSPISIEQSAPRFRDSGAYLITGGFGGMGLSIGRHLGESCKASVALVGRHIPTADPAFVEARAAIERAGGSLLCYAADVADEQAMRAVIDDVRRQRGAIHGCVHAAGVADHGGVMHRRDRATVDASIRAKVHGTSVLHRLLADQPLDFVVLCSTLGSVLPQAKFGQSGYAAANEYLDACAAAWRRQGIPATTINWDDWKDVGMSVAALKQGSAGHSHVTPAMSPDQGVEVFRRLAGSPHARVLVSLLPVNTIRQLVAERFTGRAVPAAAVAGDPASTLHELWAEALGASDLTTESNFFTLGGHSLMAIQVLTRVRELFNVNLPLAGFLDQPTLGRQTQALERALARHAMASLPASPSETDEDWTL